MTLILYEGPQRLKKTLEAMLSAWGDRRIAIARELTKQFEEFFRGTISEAVEYFSEGTRGELTLVVEGCRKEDAAVTAPQDWQEALGFLLQVSRQPVKQATDEIVHRYRLPRRMVYQKALAMRSELTGERKKQ